MLGAFLEKKKCMSDKSIAAIHGMREPDVRRRITDNIKRFKESVDFIDLKVACQTSINSDLKEVVQNDDNSDLKSCAPDAQQLLEQLGYTQMQISKSEHIYILSERGYAKLIKIMDTDLAWEIHDQLMDEYFQMREQKSLLDGLSPELQMFFQMGDYAWGIFRKERP